MFVKAVGIMAFLIAFGISKQYPAIAVQWGVAYFLYWLGHKIIKDKKNNTSNEGKNYKLSIVLGIIGIVLGLISPIIGYIFALPSFLIAENLLDKNNPKRKIALIITGISIGVCIINANIGSVLFSNNN